jgi:hypothetical protein
VAYTRRRSRRSRSQADDGGAHGVHDRRMSPTEIRIRLLQLAAERLDAKDVGLAGDPAYMADLDSEVAAYRAAYVGAVVTEIASLRGELYGRPMG